MQIIKFIRQDAKYACNFCKAKFFTKNEVEACFDGHGEEAINAVAEREKKKKNHRKGA